MNRRAFLSSTALTLSAGALLAIAPSGFGLVPPAHAQTAEIDTSTVTEMVIGAADAPVEIIEYASFTCPHCATFHTGPYRQLKEEFIDTGKVRFVYREVYFDRYGLWASMLARCGGPERFFGITDLLYENQATWSRAPGPAEVADELRRIGRLAGLEEAAMEACLQDGEMAQTLVAWYQENAQEHGIDATPSFVMNGEKVSNRSFEDFKALIEAELAG